MKNPFSRKSGQWKNHFFLPSFGAHLPGVPFDVGSKLVCYPLPRFDAAGLDLECTPMLVSNGLILDTFLRDYLEAERAPYLAPMKETLDRLAEAGLVEFVDYSECGRAFGPALERCVADHLDYPLPWLLILRQAVKIHAPLIEQQIECMHPYVDPDRERIPYSILAYIARNGGDATTVVRLQRYLNSTRKNYSPGELREIRELVRPMVVQAAFNQYMRDYLSVPFLDWDDVQPFHGRLATEGPSRAGPEKLSRDHLMAAQEIFSTTLNSLVPKDNAALIKFLKSNRSVLSLRSAISDHLAGGGQFDQRWADEVRDDAQRAQIASRRTEQTFHYMGMGAGITALAAGVVIPAVEVARQAAGLVADAAEKVAELALGETGSHRAKSRTKRYEWLYTLTSLKR